MLYYVQQTIRACKKAKDYICVILCSYSSMRKNFARLLRLQICILILRTLAVVTPAAKTMLAPSGPHHDMSIICFHAIGRGGFVVLEFALCCGLGVGEFTSWRCQGLRLAFYPKSGSVTNCHAKCHTHIGNYIFMIHKYSLFLKKLYKYCCCSSSSCCWWLLLLWWLWLCVVCCVLWLCLPVVRLVGAAVEARHRPL